MGSSIRTKTQEAGSAKEWLAELLQEFPALKDAGEWFRRERQWIQEAHLQLCRIPAPTFLEQKRAEWMAAQFRDLGYDSRIDRAGNVIARLDGRLQSPHVALTAHLDTVLAPRVAEDIAIDGDGRMRGPGTSDNGAGLSALLAIARCLRKFDLSLPVVFVANVGEEGEGNLSGMRFLCRQSPLANKVESFLILDGPATDHITSQALASRRFELSFTGAGGHSWSDFGAANPVNALSRAITLFSDLRRCDPPAPRVSFNFGLIVGGSSINSIPVDASAKVDLRSENVERLDTLAADLAACVEQALQLENEWSTTRVLAKVKEIGSRPGGGLALDAPILGILRAVDAHLGIRARLDCASTDANIPLSLGLPAVSIGAGGTGGGAHTSSEWYHPEGREKGLHRILLTLALLTRQL